ncbi:UNVERIFIED_CONTAM: hypothetical protein HDU68_000982, partial [Siphonaria sp. JEL0065]
MDAAATDAKPAEPPKSPKKKAIAPIPSRRRILVNTPPVNQNAKLLQKDVLKGHPDENKQCHFIESASVGSSNKVRTSKYTLISFLPKNLFEQFRSIANFYFLSLVILQAFPPFALVSTLLTAAPILIIVCATAAKDAIEDWRRHQSDESVNHAKTYLLTNIRNWNFPPVGEGLLVSNKRRLSRQPSDLISVLKVDQTSNIHNIAQQHLQSQAAAKPAAQPASPQIEKSRSSLFRGSAVGNPFSGGIGGGGTDRRFPDEGPFWQQNNWEDVRVGDFVYLVNGESIPADVFIVSTSEPDGACYVETKNLDGETNLKIRRGLPEFDHVRGPGDCELIQGHIDSELPSANLFTYNGIIRVNMTELGKSHQQVQSSTFDKIRSPQFKTLPIAMNSMLLRGCILRNTKWVIGIVIYTGADTKIMLNSGITPSKRSKIDRQLNPLVMLNFWLLGAMCIICSLICAVYTATFIREDALFSPLEGQYTPLYAAFVAFFSCLIIFQNIVPISLYISVDVSKTIQSLFISMDMDMYDAESDKF